MIKQLFKIKHYCFVPSKRKRQCYGKNQKVEEGLWKWFKFAQSHSAPVNGPILMQKIEEILKELGHNKFMASEGWFYHWKKDMI